MTFVNFAHTRGEVEDDGGRAKAKAKVRIRNLIADITRALIGYKSKALFSPTAHGPNTGW